MKITRVRADELNPETMLMRQEGSTATAAIVAIEVATKDVLVVISRGGSDPIPLVMFHEDLVIVEMIEKGGE